MFESESESDAKSKNWWDYNLEWSLGGSLPPALGAGLRSIPSALAAHRVGKPSSSSASAEQVGQAGAAESIGHSAAQKPAPPPKTLPPPPKPPAPVPPVATSARPAPLRAVSFPSLQSIAPAETVVDSMLDKNEPSIEELFLAATQSKAAPATAGSSSFSLEQLLDPDFLGYVGKDS